MIRARRPHPFLFVVGVLLAVMGIVGWDGVSMVFGGWLSFWAIGP